MPAHLFRAPNVYSFIDSGTTKTRLVFGCEDVVGSSSLSAASNASFCVSFGETHTDIVTNSRSG